MDNAAKARFLAKVDKRGPKHPALKTRCWLWTGLKNKHGYGRVKIAGKEHKAHRLSWFIEYGAWPTLHVLHRCDNTGCVRPSHLREGTHLDNMKDMVSKGRSPCNIGVRNPRSKLTEPQVLEILRRKESGPALAKKFGVTHVVIYDIRNGKLWGHLTRKGAQ